MKFTTAKHIRWIGFIVLTGCILLWVFEKLHSPGVFPISTVTVRGQYHHLAREDLKKIIMRYSLQGFFSIDVQEIKQRLLSEPWIKTASVRREWPSKLEIHFAEKKPIAQWNDQGLLDEAGQLFNPNIDREPLVLPKIIGPPDSQVALFRIFNRATTLLKPLGLRIKQLRMTVNHSYSLTLDNDMKIVLGRKNVWQRLQRFISIYDQVFATALRQAEIVDMQYSGGMSVKWKKTNFRS